MGVWFFLVGEQRKGVSKFAFKSVAFDILFPLDSLAFLFS